MMDKESTRFEDPRNITVGKARVIWAEAAHPISTGARHPEGYVLPGGARTASRIEAHAAAVWIDGMTKNHAIHAKNA